MSATFDYRQKNQSLSNRVWKQLEKLDQAIARYEDDDNTVEDYDLLEETLREFTDVIYSSCPEIEFFIGRRYAAAEIDGTIYRIIELKTSRKLEIAICLKECLSAYWWLQRANHNIK